MGLAACQARLLTLTMRRTDDQYKLMKLANDQLKLACDQEDIETEFDLAKNAAIYTYQYDANDKGSTENLTYSGLMGSNSLHSGRNPIYLTNTDGQVILDSAYGAAMSAATMAGNGTARDNAKCFNAFAAAMTGDNSFSWYAALKTGKNVPTAIIDAKAKEAVMPKYSSELERYKSAANDMKCEFGNPDFDYNKNSDGEAKTLYEALTGDRSYSDDFVARNYGISPKVNAAFHGQIPDYALENALTPEEREQLEYLKNLAEDAKNSGETVGYNSDYYTKESYSKLIVDFAAQRGLDASILEEELYTGQYKYPVSIIGYSIITGCTFTHTRDVYSTYDEAYATAFDYYSQNPDRLGVNYGQVSSDIKSAAEYYHNIFAKCLGTTNGKLNYKVDDQITDNAYLYAKLENNDYQVNGQTARENNNCTMKTVRDDEFQYEKAKDNYNRALNDVKKKEKQIETKKTAVQADLQSCETEIQSVNTLIQKNIERSFIYCQS